MNYKNLKWSNIKKNKKIFNKILKNSFPIERLGNGLDVINLLNFIISNNSNYLNGSNIILDGGISDTLYH